jgi:hypothetical protein
MYASNFFVLDTHLKHLRGQSNLRTFAQRKTIASGGLMTNYFCETCGTLMYRVGEKFPGQSILRIGTVDDFSLMEGVLKPKMEIWTGSKVNWVGEVQGAKKKVAQL